MTREELQALRSMTAADKLQTLHSLYTFALQLKAAGFRMQHPEWTEDKVCTEVRRLLRHARD
jgi:hypothetical protein